MYKIHIIFIVVIPRLERRYPSDVRGPSITRTLEVLHYNDTPSFAL